MGAPYTWPTAVSAIGPAAVGTLLWDNHGQRHLTVAVKASFALRHDTRMVRAQAPTLYARDEHVGGDPTRSLVRASDIVPYRPMTDVWVTGHAQSPHDRMVKASVVRVALYRDGEPLLDKFVHVIGDRVDAAAVPEPFSSMPLVYERAYGGIGHDDNPVGVGADERPLWPNIVHPEHGENVAGLGPISRYWRLRRGSLTSAQRRELERAEPLVHPGFAWGYFQAAPLDQRTPFLSGDEWLVLDGVHASMLRLQSRLPKARGVARVFALAASGEDRGDAIAMVLDTLAVDVDALTCAVTWRGVVALDPATVPAQLLVAGGVEHGAIELDWTRARDHVVPPASSRGGYQKPQDTIVEDGRSHDDLGVTHVDAAEGVSGEWSTDAWPMYPLAGIDEEVTETKTGADASKLLSSAVDYAERLPLPIDTEPGAPPVVAEDDLPWVTELAVEPDAPPAETPDMDEPESSPAETTQVMFETPERTPRPTSLPPAPIDLDAYEESLRQAGASEEDIQHLLARRHREDD